MIAANIRVYAVVVAVIAAFQCAHALMPPASPGTRNRGMRVRPPHAAAMNYNNNNHHRSYTAVNAGNTKGEILKNDSTAEDDVEDKPEIEWGVSYIGGDPCGSKYNSDPFDKNPSDKPGLPDDMKARIAALAEKKLREEQEKKN